MILHYFEFYIIEKHAGRRPQGDQPVSYRLFAAST
jgi:hypothetical protein